MYRDRRIDAELVIDKASPGTMKVASLLGAIVLLAGVLNPEDQGAQAKSLSMCEG